jgi:hypothetical protein
MFTPETDVRDERLTALIANSQSHQWAPEERIDWSEPVVPPEGLALGVYVDMVSQLYYAEEATLQVCSRMIAELPEMQAKLYVCLQVADEARHAGVYRSYLEKLGDIRPIDRGLKDVFDAALAFDGPAFGLVAALNVLMEHEALRQQQRRIETLPCPLFRQINQAIVQDESRHAAFGVIYLDATLPGRSAEEKGAVGDWLRELWRLWREANRDRYTQEGEGVLRLDQAELQSRGRHVTGLLRQLGLLEKGASIA